jgi:hypothetical protein
LASRPAGDIAEPLLSTHATMRGLIPYLLYRSADRDSSSLAKLCPTTPNPTITIRNSDTAV